MLSERVMLRYNEVRGRAFTAMGFDYKIVDGIRRYHVVRRQSDEIKLHREQPDLGAGDSGEVW